tara:strand:+ start:218 stop:520 length:303 start_codon:yes stop_codon:yes gene_type:complete
MRNFFDNFFFGLFAGLLGLVIGFYVVGFIWSLINDTDMEFWIETVFLDATFYRVQVLTSSALLNVIVFFFLYQKGVYETAKGILGTLILLVLAMAFFWAS